MKALVLAASAAFFVSAHAEDMVIPEALVSKCAEMGGCVVVVPTGQIFPIDVVRQQMAQVAQSAYLQGKEEGAQTCKRRDV